MPKKNLQKTHSNRSIWQTLGSILAWFTRSSKGKPMSWSPLKSLTLGPSTVELTSDRLILRQFFGWRLMAMRISTSSMSITPLGKPSITTRELLTQIDSLKESLKPSATHLALNGYQSSPKEESTSPRPIKKSVQTSTHGSGTALKKWLRLLSYYQGIACQVCGAWQKTVDYRTKRVCPDCLYSILVSIQSESSKPIAGKKKASHKRKT